MQARRNPSEQVEHRGEGQCAVVEVAAEALVEEHQEDGVALADGGAAAEEGGAVALPQAVEGEEGAMQISQDRQEGFEGAGHDYEVRRYMALDRSARRYQSFISSTRTTLEGLVDCQTLVSHYPP